MNPRMEFREENRLDSRSPDTNAFGLHDLDIVAQITDALVITDFDGRVRFWNAGAERIYGVRGDEILGEPLIRSHHAELPNGQAEEQVLAQVKNDGRWAGEAIHHLRGGRDLYVELEISLFRDPDGAPNGFLSVIRDATMRRAEELAREATAEGAREQTQRDWIELRKNTSLLESFLHNLPVSAYVKDEHGRYLFHNPASLELVPTLGDSAGKSDEELFGPEIAARYRASDAIVLHSDKPTRATETLAIGGTEYNLLTVKFPVVAESGKRFIAGFSVDISDNLRELRELANSIPDIVWRCNAAGEAEFLSERWEEFTGVPTKESTGTRWMSQVHPDDLNEMESNWLAALKSGEPMNTQFRLRRRDGAYRWFMARARRYTGADGRSYWYGSSTDITSEREALGALGESERSLRELADSLPQLIWVANAQGDNTYCNRQFRDYTGSPTTALSGSKWHEIIHPDDLSSTVEKWSHSLRTGAPFLNEYRLRRKDGEYRYFLARAVSLRDASGAVERWMGSSTDIHDQKLAEAALRRSEKLVTAGRLAATIAHEINNPLAAVMNALYLARHDPSVTESVRTSLDIADQELSRAAHIVTQSLRFHRQSTAPAPANVAELLESVFVLFAPRFKQSAISVEREFAANTVLRCHGDDLRQVFANLISNALDATPRGGRLRMRVSNGHAWNDPSRGGVRIAIADTGHGIPRDVRKRLFEPFMTTKEAVGTGLGLWVSAEIVRKHGGTIQVHSRAVGTTGTVFSLFFPHDGIEAQLTAKSARVGEAT